MSFPIPFVAYSPNIEGGLFFYDPAEGNKVVSVVGSPRFFNGVCGDRALIYPEVVLDGTGATITLQSIGPSGVDRPFGISVSVPSATSLSVEVVNHADPTIVARYRDSTFEPVLFLANHNNQSTYFDEYTNGFQAIMDDLTILPAALGVVS